MEGNGSANGMTGIEKVIRLRGIEPFSHCRAEEVLRLAAIATERAFAPGERLYAIDDAADACYCLVEGSVTLRGGDGPPRAAHAPSVLGLTEILRDQRRPESAVAGSESGALTLVIEAEDFFDLLSNNVEIVRSLFRALLR